MTLKRPDTWKSIKNLAHDMDVEEVTLGDYKETVSYTHLDVYKRQSLPRQH